MGDPNSRSLDLVEAWEGATSRRGSSLGSRRTAPPGHFTGVHKSAGTLGVPLVQVLTGVEGTSGLKLPVLSLL